MSSERGVILMWKPESGVSGVISPYAPKYRRYQNDELSNKISSTHSVAMYNNCSSTNVLFHYSAFSFLCTLKPFQQQRGHIESNKC